MSRVRSRRYQIRDVRYLGIGLALVVTSGVAGSDVVAATTISVQQPTATAPLVFDRVTVVDVEQGKLLPHQRVVIMGNRIQTVGAASAIPLPPGARVVEASGKYLIPGLWDLHVHAGRATSTIYPLLLANGVTGFRDAWSPVPPHTLMQWWREILAGTRIGPPRQLLSSAQLGDGIDANFVSINESPTRAQQVVDSLKAAGANVIKTYGASRKDFFAIAAAARRAGLPFGGHMPHNVDVIEASDSGARFVDHVGIGNLDTYCFYHKKASVDRCRPVAERLRHNNTWWVPTLTVTSHSAGLSSPAIASIWTRFSERGQALWPDSSARHYLRRGRGLRDSDSVGLHIAQTVGLPIVAGTDYMRPAGFSLHMELEIYVAEGLTPLNALQSATLNPARMLRATDSLGTVAAGKLADLVLLDADPLIDITNTTKIRAVVANGRYFDRAALDQVLTDVRRLGPPPSDWMRPLAKDSLATSNPLRGP